MNDLFERLMDQLNMPAEIRQNPAFRGNIDKVEVHAISKVWHFYLKFPAILPIDLYRELADRLEQAFSDIAKTQMTILTEDGHFDEDLLNSYLPLIFDLPGCDTPSFTAIFKKYKFIAVDASATAKLLVGELSNLEYFVKHYFPVMAQHYQSFGFTDLQILPEIDHQLTDKLVAEYEKKSEEALADILANQPEAPFPTDNQAPTPKEAVASPNHLTLGKEIKASDTVFQMKDVVTEEANVVFEGYVFAAEHKVFKNRTTGKESHMLEVKMTDYSSSFIVQKWGRKPEEQAMFDMVKKGMWVKVKGSVQMDQYKHELVMSARDMVEIKAKNVRKDLMPEGQKRVEFHAHTNMSTMDAIPDVSDLVAQAARWGHKAIAITDHAGAQSFPHAHSAGKKNGVKIIYGIEANLVEDRVPITYNEDDSSLSDSTYVVFDVETTGLSAVYNKLIQVAASKMHKGNVIEQFDEFIDPGHPLSEFTTQLTGITDDMVRGSKPLEQVLKAFQAFCQGSILVAHNATFDVGFMNMNYQRHDLPVITQPVIDTLEFARNLYPEFKRHGLGPLTKRFQVSLESHHLANFDAEATGRLLFIFLKDAKEKFGIELLSDLNTKVVDADSYKRARVKHATIYAKTQDGLKNLFKLISYSNVNYFSGVPRIPKSVLEAHREGLIIGSACSEGEVFEAVTNKSFDDALKVAAYYDFIEIMPPAIYRPLIAKETIKDEVELQRILKDMMQIADKLGKPVLATGNVHYLNPEDAVYREIIVRSLGAGAIINRPVGRGEHAMPAPLPEVHFRTTNEMLDDFAFLGAETARQIVIENTQKMAESFDVLTPVRDDLYTPYIPESEEKMAQMTYERAHATYGNPLPDIVDLRIEKELNSIIGNGFSVIYLISQILVQRSNERGYLVGSRGSVGSSFVATMTGITEVNPLPPHYVCPECQYSEFFTEGQYGSGFDMPEKQCPECGHRLTKD